MKQKEVLYRIDYCPAIFDCGVVGAKGSMPLASCTSRGVVSDTSALVQQANRLDHRNPLDCQNKEAGSTAVDSPRNEDKELMPFVRISLDGTQVYKAPLGENLCIPTKAIEQVVDHLLACGKYSRPQGRGDTQEQIGSICLSIQRDNERKQAHILFPQAKRDQHTHLIEFRQSASDKTREQIDRHTATPSCHLDNEAL